jgi:hypothetical protein
MAFGYLHRRAGIVGNRYVCPRKIIKKYAFSDIGRANQHYFPLHAIPSCPQPLLFPIHKFGYLCGPFYGMPLN